MRLQSKTNDRVVSFDYGTQMIKEVQASRDYLLAFKYGYLSKKSKTWYKSWEERFYVLSNIGLVYMLGPSDKSIKLFPFLDFEVVEVPEATYERQWVMAFKSIKGQEMVVQANSKQDYKEWIEAFKKFKKQLEESKKY